MKSARRCDISRSKEGCQNSNDSTADIYDEYDIQKLTEVFSFDYTSNQDGPYGNSSSGECVRSEPKCRCFRKKEDMEHENFTYAPLELFGSPTYTSSIPAPRSETSEEALLKLRRPQSLNLQNQLLLHDLFSGDIYES